MNNTCFTKLIEVEKVNTVFNQSFKKGYNFKGEKHDFYEFVVITNGSACVNLDDNMYILEKSQGIIYKPNEFHHISAPSENGFTQTVISFCAKCFPKFQNRILHLTLNELRMLEDIVELSDEIFEKDGIRVLNFSVVDTYKTEKFRLKLELLLLDIIFKDENNQKSDLKMKDIYLMAVKLMEENPSVNYKTKDIAERFMISQSYLKKIFKKYANCGVRQYFNDIRVRIACAYLDNGKSVKEVSMLLGFSDQNYFSTFFKRIKGISPVEFKKMSSS